MLLKAPKDLGQPLDSKKGLKYLIFIWHIIATIPLNGNLQVHWRVLIYVYSGVMNLFCSLYFPATMWINLFFIETYTDLVANLSSNISISMSVIKHSFVFMYRHRLLESNTFLKLLDERSSHHSQDRKHIFNVVHYSQLYFLYLPFYVFCGVGFAYNGWIHHKMICNAWYPEFFSDSEDNYLAAFIFQYITQAYVVIQCVFNDTYPMCYLSLMIGHLESLAARISRIGWSRGLEYTQEHNIEELKNCIKDHKNLLGYFDCICPVISITMFCQFCIAGFALCLTAIRFTFFRSDVSEQFFTLIYVVIILIQMFPCCWCVNVVMEKSNYLTTAMYSCNWMDQNLKFRKMLIIFMQHSQKENTIMAGNLIPVTLQTFLSIIRFAFSMYTIFRKM